MKNYWKNSWKIIPGKHDVEATKKCEDCVIILQTYFRVNLHSSSCLNVKELFARDRRDIWKLNDCNGIHNHLVRKQTLNNLSKWLNDWVFVHELSGCGLVSCCSLKNCYFQCQNFFFVWTSSDAKFTIIIPGQFALGENCPPVKIKVWVRIRVRCNFPQGQLS